MCTLNRSLAHMHARMLTHQILGRNLSRFSGCPPCLLSHLSWSGFLRVSFTFLWGLFLMRPLLSLTPSFPKAGVREGSNSFLCNRPRPGNPARMTCLHYPPLAQDELFQRSHTNAATPGSHKGYDLGYEGIWGLRHTTRPSSVRNR